MPELIIACPGCGKKFRIQEEAEPGEFKCTSCGGSVPYGNVPRARPAKAVPARPAGRAKGPARAAAPARGGQSRGPGRPARGRAAPRGRPARGRRGGRYADDEDYGPPPKDNTALYIVLAIVGVLVVGGGIAAIALSGGDDPIPEQPIASNNGNGGQPPVNNYPSDPLTPDPEPDRPNPGGGDTIAPLPDRLPTGTGGGNLPNPAGAGAGTGNTPTRPPRSTGGHSGEGIPEGASLFDQPRMSLKMLSYDRLVADLDHFEDTPAALRSEIDKLCATLVDFFAGRDAIDAANRLAEIGRPAAPRILACFTKVGDMSSREGLTNSCVVDDAFRRIVGDPLEMMPLKPMSVNEARVIRKTVTNWYVWWYTTGHKLEEFATGGGDEEGGEEE